MAVQTAAERPFAIGDQIEWNGEDGTKHTGQVRSMGDPGVTTDNAWLPWNTKGLRKVPGVKESVFVSKDTECAAVHTPEEKIQTAFRLQALPLDQVSPSPQNPRGQASMGDLQALADDIRVNGQINPITVRQLDEARFEIITGERRYRACALAELPTVMAINRGAISVEEALIERIRENAQREQLTPLEEAKAIEFLYGAGQTDEQIAAVMGKTREWTNRTRNLGRMPGEAQDILAKGRISRSVAEALLPLALYPKALVEYARLAASGGWSSRTTATEVKAKLDALAYERQMKERKETTTVTTTTRPNIPFVDDETTDIPAGERTAQEALTEADADPEPLALKTEPELSPEEAAAAKAKLANLEAMRERYTDVCDALWEAINKAGIAGTECDLLVAVETAIECWQGTGVFAKKGGGDDSNQS